MDQRLRRFFFFMFAALLMLAAGCGFRPLSEAASASPDPDAEPVRVTGSQEPTAPPAFTVTYFIDGQSAASETVERGACPVSLPDPEGVRLLGWTDPGGTRADPLSTPVLADSAYYAVSGPLLSEDADWLFPDEHGFLLPQAPFTGADAAAALTALLADSTEAERLSAQYEANVPLTLPQLRELLNALFLPETVEQTLSEAFPTGEETVDRARVARCVETLLGRTVEKERYFPDVSPDHWAFDQLTAAAAPGTLDRDALMTHALDGFLWLDGYLYRLDEEGYFIVSRTEDGLTYGKNGRYTSGDEQLDAYVAQSLTELMEPGKTREELLRIVYLHVKNDFKYLVRNYYASGETGWEIPEALTMFETGKGNCYNYAGVFWALSRGLGYNTSVFSGTQGLQYTPHAWSEILLDGHWYICDPELEMNYWYVAAMTGDNSKYTNNYMIPREKSANWVYQAPGRE